MASSSSSSTMFIDPISSSEAFKEASNCKSKSFTLLCDFLRQERSSTKPIDVRRNTILHVMAMHGNSPAFRKLFDEGLLTHGELMTGNKKDNTALHEAARFGQKGVVQILLDKEKDLVMARNDLGETPLFVAAASGKKDVFNILLNDKSHSDILTRSDDCTVLHAAIMGEYYSLAMSILESFPDLARKYDANGMTALHLLATKPLSFKSGSPYSYANLGTRPFIPLEFIAIFIYFCIPSMIVGWKHSGGDVENQHQNSVKISKSKGNWVTRLISGFRWMFRGMFKVFPWVKEIDDAKQKHVCALALAKKLVEKERTWSHYLNDESYKVENSKTKKTLQNPLIQATENGIIEIVKEILKKFPDAAYSFDKDGKNILHIAVEQKDRNLYEYLKKKVDHKDGMLADVDNHGNNVLHLAANLGGTNPRVHLGHWNHMIWDMCWFKRVWFDCPPHFLYIKNSSGETAKDLFETYHSDLREKAEKAFKDMNNGLMLVTALIGTVNYAALFTIPGGFDQDKTYPNGTMSDTYGRPVFLVKEDNSRWDSAVSFLVYVSLALFTSLIALGTMLSIQMSRFRSNDFYMALPLKYILAVAALFCSTFFTIAACLQVFILDGIYFTTFYPTLLFTSGCILMALVYVDVLFLNFYYMYFVIRYSFAYKGQQM